MMTPAKASKQRKTAYAYCGCRICRAALKPCPLTYEEHQNAMNASWDHCLLKP